ncbi:response regulator [Rhizobium sophoriradicis]|uniref:Two-component system response regulator n=1 Tax=Rhizobium sophoriradicis TaxID=1535245 RepID=A0A2A5KX99_9HYPH|nr:response regulator [Rhizobium sophoriradicis]PCK81679.1 two-component system response regulator [Rhizobium sophoriradicis]
MKTKVVVVEDDALLLMMAVGIVEEAGLEALEARNADEALMLFENVPGIRILFTDIDMPGSMDGLKLANAVRNRWPPVEIIIVSGMKQPGKDELPERGVFFPKPYDTRQLCDALVRMAA